MVHQSPEQENVTKYFVNEKLKSDFHFISIACVTENGTSKKDSNFVTKIEKDRKG